MDACLGPWLGWDLDGTGEIGEGITRKRGSAGQRVYRGILSLLLLCYHRRKHGIRVQNYSTGLGFNGAQKIY